MSKLSRIKTKILNIKKRTIILYTLAVIAIGVAVFLQNYGKINIDDATIISTHENVFSKINGDIFEIPVKEHNTVNKGDLLVKIFPAKYEINLKNLQSQKIQTKKELATAKKLLEKRTAELDLAKKDCDRNQSMFDENISSKNDFDRSINEMRNANVSYLAAKTDAENIEKKLADLENKITLAKIDLENTNVLATESGEITSIFAQKGESIIKGKLLVSINSNRFVIVIPKKQKKFSKILPEQPVSIKLKGNPIKLTGKIDKILPIEDFDSDENLMITDKCTILSVKTDENYSDKIDGFQNVKMTIKIK